MKRLLGKTVIFVPTMTNNGEETKYDFIHPVKGVVTYVNESKLYFTADYDVNGTTVRESFKITDLGNGVALCE